ncbi:MAG: hypothetical protein ACI4PU_01685, partial [Intestinibacter sp.]
LCYASFILISAVYLLLFSMTTSPIYRDYYVDYGFSYSASKLLMGKSMANGMTPYVDLFGTSGSVMYLFQSIGWFFGNGKLGVFLIQLALLSVVLIFTYKSLNLFVSDKFSYILTIIMMVFVVATYGAGNTDEEMCLPFIMVVFYIVMSYLKEDHRDSFCVIRAVVLGFCLGVVAMIRFNDAFAIVGLIFALFIFMKRDNLLKVISGMLVGALAVVLPCILYYSYKNGLKEMLDGVFLYNLKYMTTGFDGLNIILRKLIKAVPCLFLIFASVVYALKEDRCLGISVLVFAVFTLFSIIPGDVSWHYFIVEVPYAFVAFAMIAKACDGENDLKLFKLANILGIALSFVVMLVPLKSYLSEVYDANVNKSYVADNQKMIDIADKYIEDKGSVALVDVPASFYLINDIMPQNRMFVEQTVMAHVDYDVAIEIQEYLYSTPTKNLIIASNGWIYQEYGQYVLAEFFEDIQGKDLAVYDVGIGEDVHEH